MANLTHMRLEEMQTIGIKTVCVPFSFQLNGTSAPTNAQGLKCSVARSDTGLFTVTLPSAFPTTMAVLVGAEVTGAKLGLLVEASGSPISGTFQVRTMTLGTTTLVDVAASATVRVNCLLIAAAAGTRSRTV